MILRILDGRSDRPEVSLSAGRPVPPFGVGSEGAWRVTAAHVAATHLLLAFDGRQLYVCAWRGALALLDGTPLDGHWREVRAPGELRFGAARLLVTRGGVAVKKAAIIPRRSASGDVVTRVACPQAALARSRAFGDDVVTCFDEGRLRAALARVAAGAEGADVTVVADVEVPPLARREKGEDVPPARTTAPCVRPPAAAAARRRTVRLVRTRPPAPFVRATDGDDAAQTSPTDMTSRLQGEAPVASPFDAPRPFDRLRPFDAPRPGDLPAPPSRRAPPPLSVSRPYLGSSLETVRVPVFHPHPAAVAARRLLFLLVPALLLAFVAARGAHQSGARDLLRRLVAPAATSP